MERPAKRNDLSRSLIAFDQASTLVAVVELSRGSWLAAGLVPNLIRQPVKKLRSDPEALLGLLLRSQDQAIKAGAQIRRIVLAFDLTPMRPSAFARKSLKDLESMSRSY